VIYPNEWLLRKDISASFRARQKKRNFPRPEKSSIIPLTNLAYKCKMHIDAIPVFKRSAYRCEKLEMNRVDELLIVGSDKTRKERKLQWLRIQ
jgi:hypothetical protein